MAIRPSACVKLNPAPHYCKGAFESGLQKHGFEIVTYPSGNPNPGDVLVTWNRHPRDEAYCRRYEMAGATVLVTENAWLDHGLKEDHLFALCKSHHNGAGEWYTGESNRYPIDVKPWRTEGNHILVLPSRGMGERGVRQEKEWLPDVTRRLASLTKRRIVVQHHPGPRPHPPLDFTDCWAVVTWASGAAIKAIVSGIPAFYELPNWIGAPAARPGLDNLEDPFLGDRQEMLHRLSWAQWSSQEIGKGEPFKWLLS